MRPGAFRTASTVLLAVMVVATLGGLAIVGGEVIRRQGERTQELVEQVRLDLLRAERARIRAADLAARTLRLEAQRLRLSVLVETCTIARLQGQRLPRCQQVRARVHTLEVVIEEFRERLARARARAASGPGGSSGGGTSTVTRTATRTRTPPPTVGNSDECPPNNPQC